MCKHMARSTRHANDAAIIVNVFKWLAAGEVSRAWSVEFLLIPTTYDGDRPRVGSEHHSNIGMPSSVVGFLVQPRCGHGRSVCSQPRGSTRQLSRLHATTGDRKIWTERQTLFSGIFASCDAAQRFNGGPKTVVETGLDPRVFEVTMASTMVGSETLCAVVHTWALVFAQRKPHRAFQGKPIGLLGTSAWLSALRHAVSRLQALKTA